MSNNASTRKMTFFIAFSSLERITAVSAAPVRALRGVSLRHHPLAAYNKNESQLREYSFSGRVGIRNGSFCVCFHGKSRDHVMRQVAPPAGDKGQSRLPVFGLSDRRSRPKTSSVLLWNETMPFQRSLVVVASLVGALGQLYLLAWNFFVWNQAE